MPPPGFKEIARSLTEDNPPGMEATNTPQGLASPCLLVGSTMATMMSMETHQDKMTGNIYMNTVTASMGLLNLETPLMVGDCLMPIIEDITEMDMVDDHLK